MFTIHTRGSMRYSSGAGWADTGNPASRFKSQVSSANLLGGERGVNTTTRPPVPGRRFGVGTHQLAGRLVVADLMRQRTWEMERNQRSHKSGDTSSVGRERVPARLRVRLLGAVEIILDGPRLPAFNSLRLQRFLALIALRRDPQHRSRLAFELWPDSDERQARTNLRKLLHDFRHSLPDIGE